MSVDQQSLPRAVLRKAPQAAPVATASECSDQQAVERALPSGGPEHVEPFCFLDADSWQICAQDLSEVLTTNADFSVVGVLGPQGTGKSSFLNRLLGLEGLLPAAGPHPTPAFPVAPGLAPALAGRHCTRGISLRASADRLLALDTQPLFSASVLEEMLTGWDQPPPALAIPAVAAAGEAKAAAVPYEGVHALAQLQLAVLLLSACHRVLVFCEGMQDRQTWELLLTAEMLCRGIPDPSLPPREATQAGKTGGAGAAGPAAAGAPAGQQAGQVQPQRQAPPQEHLAQVVLVHVLPPSGSSGRSGGGGSSSPTAAELQLLEQRLDAFFASSRLRQPGALRMLEQAGSLPDGSGSSSREGIGYWVLPALQDDGAEEAWAALVAQLLSRPHPGFARPCSERGWLRGVAGDTWRAVRKSPDIASFYSRLARTQLKGAAGWGLAR